MRIRNTAPPTHCTVASCTNVHLAKGYCRKHYVRVRRYGDPNITKGPANGTAQTFAQNLIDNGADTDDCITWPFGVSEKGHAVINRKDDDRKLFYTSRYIHENRVKQPSPLHLTLHTCHKGHEACVNPRHLYWGTQSDNTHDMVVAGRHPTQKITPDVAQAIWDAKGSGTKHAIAALFDGATINIVTAIWYADGWASHITK